ncbi:MAG: Glu-tRNA(Gln) amidotransferase subunit GatD [Candidatus Aenigmatarchaeota archaeon]
MSYGEGVRKRLEEAGAEEGDRIKVSKENKEYTGRLMPRSKGDEDVLVLKLDSGYNIGIENSKDLEIEKLKERSKEKERSFSEVKESFDIEEGDKPEVSILMAGGTIASRVDYRTGAVKPSFSKEELISFTPEIANIADIEGREVLQTLSENIKPGDWIEIANAVKEEIEKGKEGIVIAHGTDTMGYTAAALSFILEDLPIPVVLVGSQRSSDRPSSDAHQNLTCAVKAATSDIAEVMVCMHGSSSDDYCCLHPGTKVRKIHTSRRDAFRTINDRQIARIGWEELDIEILKKGYRRKDKGRELKLKDSFNKNVALVKSYPGLNAKMLEKQLEGTKGVVIEGTGLGHMPLDKETKEAVQDYIEDGNIVYMTSQCLNGRVNMNVYETGVDLQEMGVKGNLNDMLPETAYVKLGWLLGNYDKKEARELMNKNLRGEISERSEHDEF